MQPNQWFMTRTHKIYIRFDIISRVKVNFYTPYYYTRSFEAFEYQFFEKFISFYKKKKNCTEIHIIGRELRQA